MSRGYLDEDGDEYVRVRVKYLRRTSKGVQVDAGDDHKPWIPRSTLHAGDDRACEALRSGDFWEPRVRQWVADREALPPAT